MLWIYLATAATFSDNNPKRLFFDNIFFSMFFDLFSTVRITTTTAAMSHDDPNETKSEELAQFYVINLPTVIKNKSELL